ncbi:OadG family protein [Thiorhodovibrio frisius]|uniref:Oxaloacetate decarboxylase gamma chain n=1 Tax=Thiorhodovibrio frisius TaxID=631362 RepID=H8Z850_9GAMM|nr:OadG family protein [Thiorhodovibrio frisius]EIC19985.1 sodium pump decarboxylase gamma subunit family protein [Thiorhodovibrio frisius]WPL20714.1 oxaloacetate decarboxylase subunit gamma [Thiorhodovibrio frisius]
MESAVIDTQMMGEGLRLMLIGMSIVFGFLMLLVVLLRGMSWLATRLAPADLHDGAAGSVAVAAGTGVGAPAAETELIAVLAAAVARYRARQPS